MRKILFEPEAFNDYNEWANDDIKNFRRIARLILDIQKHPFEGLGKPEPLKYNLKGCWSRRISELHRLVYRVTDIEIIIMSCKYHY